MREHPGLPCPLIMQVTFSVCPLLGCCCSGQWCVYLGSSALEYVQRLLASLAPPARNRGAKEQEHDCHPGLLTSTEQSPLDQSPHEERSGVDSQAERSVAWNPEQTLLWPRKNPVSTGSSCPSVLWPQDPLSNLLHFPTDTFRTASWTAHWLEP